MWKQLKVAFWMTVVTTILCGIIYPLAVTGAAQLLFPHRANGSLLTANGKVVGSQWIGQNFTSPNYFHARPSAAGTGYDPMASGGSNLGPTNHQLADRIQADATKLHAENPAVPVPSDLLTTSGSGLDPEISLEGAEFQVPRVAKARAISEPELRALIQTH